MSERKASDIILDLELKIESLIKKIDSQDLILKAQHNKLNELIRILNSTIESKEKKSNFKIVNPEIINQPKLPKIVEKKVEPVLKTNEVEVKKQEEFKDFNEKFKVTQRVLDVKGKALYMVAIQVTNLADNSIITRVTTKGNGKFSVELPAGKYRFKYSKQIDMNSPRMENSMDISVIEDKNLEDIILS